MMILTFFNAQVMFLLTDPKMFNVPLDKIGYVSGLLASVAAPFSIFAALVAGYVFEICGRRKTILVCLLIAACTLGITPWTAPKLVPWLFVVKCAQQFFVNIPICNPLCADYMQHDAIGRGTSINGLGLIVGEVLSMGVLFRFTADMSNTMAFAVATAAVILLTLIVTLMIKEPEDLV